jgi:hypothetical protein
MAHQKAHESQAHENPVKAPLAPAQTSSSSPAEETNDIGNKIATVAVVGLGAALIEAELIPGILIGAAAMLMPNVFPKFGKALRPLVKQTVRAGYALAGRAREGVAELNEQMQDIVAEVKSETPHVANAPNTPSA